MAQGFFNTFSKSASADSAGTQPAEKVDKIAVQVIKEKHIDISGFLPKLLSFSMNSECDVIVTMGCIDGCPITPRDKTIEWIVENPKGKGIGAYREIRNQLSSGY